MANVFRFLASNGQCHCNDVASIAQNNKNNLNAFAVGGLTPPQSSTYLPDIVTPALFLPQIKSVYKRLLP